jgi:uncharacterized protein YbjQ (UPF0145 family)
MMITSQDNFSDYEIVETVGLVKGNSVRAKHAGKDFMAGLKGIGGGEIDEYTEMLSETRELAIERMMALARDHGADGVVCVRLTTSTVMQNMAELLAYGTAVKLRKK